MGISTVSSKNALENMMIELPHWDFEKVKSDAEQKWENELDNGQQLGFVTRISIKSIEAFSMSFTILSIFAII